MSTTHAQPVVARLVPARTAPTKTTPTLAQRIKRRLQTLLIGVAVLFIATMGVGAGTQPANAWGLGDIVGKMGDLFCFGTVGAAPAPYSSNSDSSLFGNRAPDSYGNGSWAHKSVTAYEEYGTSGLYWSEWRPKDASDNSDHQAGCITNKFGQFIGNSIANEMFSFTTTVSEVTIGMFRWATNGDLLSSFDHPMDCVIKGCNGGKGLRDTLFLNYLIPIIMIGALWGAWNGLVKKRTTETAQGGLWMIGATAFAFIFMASPSIIASHANTFVNGVTTTITNSVTSASSSAMGRSDMCWTSGPDAGNRMAACSMYKAMLVTPWSAGQFGVPLGETLPGSTSVHVGNRSFNDLRVAQIEGQTVSHDELASGKPYADIATADGRVWMSVKDDVAKGTGKASYVTWSGNQWGQRVNIALASIVASLCLGFLVIIISFSTVILGVAMVLLIMLAPLFLLIGVHPGFGRGIALKWLELLLGTVVKRIILAAVLAILVGMYQTILETPGMPWFAQIALIMALGIGAIIFRKPMLETLNVINLGGSRTGMEQGIHREAKKGASGTAGALAGAVGGVRTGGPRAALGGAVRGGIMGSRSSSPVRAATMGHAAGQRVGNKHAAPDEAERKAALDERDRLQRKLKQDPFDPDVWDAVEQWNKGKKAKRHGAEVQPPTGSSGGVPYPDSAKEARRRQRQDHDRNHNNAPDTDPHSSGGSSGGGGQQPAPRPQPPTPAPAPAPAPTPAPTPGPVPAPTGPRTPPAGGPAPHTPQNGTPRAGGIPTAPPAGTNAPNRAPAHPTPPSNGTPPDDNNPPHPRPSGPPRPQGR